MSPTRGIPLAPALSSARACSVSAEEVGAFRFHIDDVPALQAAND